jgi:hypothetical protein
MPRFRVAQVREQGVDLVIVPRDNSFAHKSDQDWTDAVVELQIRASAVGLPGSVVAVWDTGGGGMAFIAPQNEHQFFSSISLAWIWANVNREIYW